MPSATVEHVTPGRIRLKFSGQKGNTPFFEELVSPVSQYPAVEEARGNPLTGSLLVRHTGSLEDLMLSAVPMGLISSETLAAIRDEQTSSEGSLLTLLRTQAGQIPVYAIAALGALQLLRGRAFGPASEHLWHATEIWRRGMPQAAAGLALLGLVQLSRANLLGSASRCSFTGSCCRMRASRSRRVIGLATAKWRS